MADIHMVDVLYLYKLAFPNGKLYIGITNSPQRRFYQHTKRKSNHPCANAIRKYGHENVFMEILAIGHKNYIKECEIRAISVFNTTNPQNGYNLHPGGTLGAIKGCVVNDETKAKISQSLLGHNVSEETREKLRQANVGKTISDDVKAKISQAGVGNSNAAGHHHDAETRLKISQSLMGNTHTLGFHHTDETRAKMSVSHTGRKRAPFTEEHKARISAAKKGTQLIDGCFVKLQECELHP
jgi:predicted GIY-YIG superfamily endonuclease